MQPNAANNVRNDKSTILYYHGHYPKLGHHQMSCCFAVSTKQLIIQRLWSLTPRSKLTCDFFRADCRQLVRLHLVGLTEESYTPTPDLVPSALQPL